MKVGQMISQGSGVEAKWMQHRKVLELCVHGSSPDHLIFVLVCIRTILSYGSSLFSSFA